MVVVLQIGIGAVFFSLPAEVAKLDSYIHDKKDIVYFGDSTIGHIAKTDIETKTMPQILQKDFPRLHIGTIDHPAYWSSVYTAFILYMKQRHYFPAFVIIPINLRSFSPDWEENPGFQFEEEKLYAKTRGTLLYPFLPFLTAYGGISLYPISDDVFKNYPVIANKKKIGTIGDFDNPSYHTYSAEKMKKKIQVYYLYDLTKNDKNLQNLSAIADAFSHTPTRVIFYITPIDYQTGERYFKKDFLPHVRSTVGVIKQTLSKKHAIVVDMSFALPEGMFDWKQDMYVNEHLNERGRNYVVEKLAQQIRIISP